MPKGLQGFQKGHPTFNKGKCPHLYGIKNSFYGKKHSEETNEINRLKHLGKKYPNRNKGVYKDPDGRKRKISKTLKKLYKDGKRKPNHFKHKEESKQRIREFQVNNPNRKFKDTSIELKIEAELQKQGINYQKQVPLCKVAIVDFYLPEYRIVIQCDGDYWHNRIDAKERDKKQDFVLTFNGFNVYRFWEHEINKSAKGCVKKLGVPPK